MLIIALGLILGGVIGSLVALLRYVVTKRPHEQVRFDFTHMPKKIETEINSPTLAAS
ncbi:hypothetical protein D3C77_806220 [compost metagenome]